MSDDINNKIKQIIDILGQENMQETVRNMLSMLTQSSSENSGQGDKQQGPPDTGLQSSGLETREAKSEEVRDHSSRSDNADLNDITRKIVRAIEKLNTRDDPRINLLMAIRPFINSKRQKMLNSAVQILNVTRVIGMLDESQDN